MPIKGDIDGAKKHHPSGFKQHPLLVIPFKKSIYIVIVAEKNFGLNVTPFGGNFLVESRSSCNGWNSQNLQTS